MTNVGEGASLTFYIFCGGLRPFKGWLMSPGPAWRPPPPPGLSRGTSSLPGRTKQNNTPRGLAASYFVRQRVTSEYVQQNDDVCVVNVESIQGKYVQTCRMSSQQLLCNEQWSTIMLLIDNRRQIKSTLIKRVSSKVYGCDNSLSLQWRPSFPVI